MKAVTEETLKLGDHAKIYKRACYVRPGLNPREYMLARQWGEREGAHAIHGCATVADFEAVGQEKPTNRISEDRKLSCGCVICICEDDEQCHGCGGTHCGKPRSECVINEWRKSRFIPADVPEIDKIKADLADTAFHYVKELVPFLETGIKYYHAREKHHTDEFINCRMAVCYTFHSLMSIIDENLFHGTLEDLTGVKPTVGGAE